MDNEARLMRAMAAASPPSVDPGFMIAVMEAAERQRFRAETAHRLLRVAGMAAAAAALAAPFWGWAAANAEALQNGILMAGGLLALVAFTRVMTQRATAALHG